MHSKAFEKISNKIKGSLMNCEVKDNWPQFESFSIHVDSLANEVLKHKNEWLDRSDVFSIFYDFVFESITSVTNGDESVDGNLWDILGEENSQQLVEVLKEYFVSIPRTFDIYIPLPNISQNIPPLIELSEELSVISFQETDEIPGGYHSGLLSLNSKLEIGKVFIRHRISGYAGKRLENICLKKVFNSFRIIIQQGMFRELFRLTPEGKARLGLFGAFEHHQVMKSKIISVDNAYDKPKISTVELPIDICRLLNNIDLNWGDNLITKVVEKNELDKAVYALLRKPVQLIACQDEEAERVKSAIKWSFDSYVVENQTLAFLQVCIGLEALLGDATYNGALTETLADRCAYLLADSIKGRKAIKKKFAELYKVRSKLVHGNVTELNNDQIKHLNWGKSILEFAIAKEIKHLNLGKT